MTTAHTFRCEECTITDDTRTTLDPTTITLRCPSCSEPMTLVSPLDRILNHV